MRGRGREGTYSCADGDAGDAGAVDVCLGQEGGHDVLDAIARIRRRRRLVPASPSVSQSAPIVCKAENAPGYDAPIRRVRVRERVEQDTVDVRATDIDADAESSVF